MGARFIWTELFWQTLDWSCVAEFRPNYRNARLSPVGGFSLSYRFDIIGLDRRRND